ncbi:hypothetical protein QWJ46_23055 [Rhizobium sp. CBN3]|uniref:hypothetical protein n=1 Tax=Rhizobium sp. CBN3 TaxID=3058045 RepID=UPI0026735D3D|nr:hypothetical protein [Rhizobium sp. CBN3]MDO3435556.1 hypothetical protein [Rhizobium sp. CBN3]
MPYFEVSINNVRNIIRAAIKAALSISEGYALKYFILYALVCSVVGIILLVVFHQIAPVQMERPGDQTAFEPDDLVVRSTREPGADQPAMRPPSQWDLRLGNQPAQRDQSGVRKGGRVGTPAQ